MSDVEHVPEQARFQLRDGDEVAVLTYDEEDDGRVALLHTVVPPSMEGRGVGGSLAEAAVAWVRDGGREVVPVCSFVRGWLQRHPEALER